MKKGFTIVEVSILFVIFLIVAFLVAPLSLDDTIQAKNTSRWRAVQQDFSNIFYAAINQKEESSTPFLVALRDVLDNEIEKDIQPYRINYMNGAYPSSLYRFKDFKTTFSKAVIAIKMFETPNENLHGVLMYDVNGVMGPNVWGRDVFGMNIYDDKFEPFGSNETVATQRKDCSKNGTGLFCSNYYLIGGNFD